MASVTITDVARRAANRRSGSRSTAPNRSADPRREQGCFYNCKGDGYSVTIPSGRYCSLGIER